MGAVLSNIACNLFGNLYLSYTSYRALKHNASNAELVSRLITWLMVNMFLATTARVTDPTLGLFFPFYYVAKIGFVGWMVHPRAQGANYLYIRHIEPAIRELSEPGDLSEPVD